MDSSLARISSAVVLDHRLKSSGRVLAANDGIGVLKRIADAASGTHGDSRFEASISNLIKRPVVILTKKDRLVA